MGTFGYLCQSKDDSHRYVLEAARKLAGLVSDEDLERGSLYPSLSDIRPISEAIAVAVTEYAYEKGLASGEKPQDLPAAIKASMYTPGY